MRYLLDTNIVSDLIKNPSGKAAQRIRPLSPGAVCTTVIVAGELRYGAFKKASAPLSQRVNLLLREIPVLSMDAACAEAYGRIRADLEQRGLPIGANDLWIAAHALVLQLVLVTHNTQEFSRVGGLVVENWLD